MKSPASKRGRRSVPSSGWFLAAMALAWLGCDGPEKPSKVDQLVSAAKKPAEAPLPSAPDVPKWTKMPEVTVDDLGPYIGGRRPNLRLKTGREQLKKLIEALPINDEQVTLLAQPKAKVTDVSRVVYLLGKAGAPTVLIKTKGRGDLPGEIIATPQSHIKKPNPCSIATTVTKDYSTGVWAFRGGGGSRARKGLAGPDLSQTERYLQKAFKRCKSDTAFFAAHKTHKWEHAFNLGALITKVDKAKHKRIEKLVLLDAAPAGGRKVDLAPRPEP